VSALILNCVLSINPTLRQFDHIGGKVVRERDDPLELGSQFLTHPAVQVVDPSLPTLSPVPASIGAQYSSKLSIVSSRVSRSIWTSVKPALANILSSCLGSANANESWSVSRCCGRNECIRKNAPHRCPVRGGNNTYCRAAPASQDAPELDHSEKGVQKELQSELAYDGIKTAIPERQRLTICRHRPKRQTPRLLACR
jgi:hypothetical protein